jgi:hypothetical protein
MTPVSLWKRSLAVLAALAALALVPAAHAQDETAAEAPPATEDAFAADAAEAPPAEAGDGSLPLDRIAELIALPPGAQLGREADEDINNPGRGLFGDENVAKQILGEKPRFIYYPKGADPMIIPWVRDAIVAAEKFADAEKAIAAGQLEAARDLLKEIVSKYPDTAEGKKAPDLIASVERRIAAINDPRPGGGTEFLPPPTSEGAELPKDVRERTNGIIFSANPRVLVFDFILAEGDRVPRYPGIRVKKITEAEVVYEFQGQDFPVPVDGRLQ